MFKKSNLPKLIEIADSGDLDAQIELAGLYKDGAEGLPANPFLAYKYYSLAAKHNHPEALFFIATCQDRGIMMPHNYGLALKNYIKAADQNHPNAAFAAGFFYEAALSTAQNIKQAKHYYRIAAANGHTLANAKIEELNDGNYHFKATKGDLDPDTQNMIAKLKLEERSIFELAIQSIPFLKGISESHLLFLTGNLMTKSVETSEVLFNQGDQSNGLFILLSGELSVSVKILDEKVVDILTINPTEYVGEFGLIDGEPRSATVSATCPSELAFFSQKSFDALIKDQKDLIELIISNLCDIILKQEIVIENHRLKQNIIDKNFLPKADEMKKLVKIIREDNDRHALHLMRKQEKTQ
jgi:CRP-like cAMP-binding protein